MWTSEHKLARTVGESQYESCTVDEFYGPVSTYRSGGRDCHHRCSAIGEPLQAFGKYPGLLSQFVTGRCPQSPTQVTTFSPQRDGNLEACPKPDRACVLPEQSARAQ
jgi:hypothetical protein